MTTKKTPMWWIRICGFQGRSYGSVLKIIGHVYTPADLENLGVPRDPWVWSTEGSEDEATVVATARSRAMAWEFQKGIKTPKAFVVFGKPGDWEPIWEILAGAIKKGATVLVDTPHKRGVRLVLCEDRGLASFVDEEGGVIPITAFPIPNPMIGWGKDGKVFSLGDFVFGKDAAAAIDDGWGGPVDTTLGKTAQICFPKK